MENKSLSVLMHCGTLAGCQRFTVVETYNDEGLNYADRKWHNIEVLHKGIRATVTIDGLWSGDECGN
jgi:hypothetical protein